MEQSGNRLSEVTMTFSVTIITIIIIIIIIIIIVAFNDIGEVIEWFTIFFTEIFFAVNPKKT